MKEIRIFQNNQSIANLHSEYQVYYELTMAWNIILKQQQCIFEKKH